MWQKLVDLARFAWNIGEDTRQNSQKISELTRGKRRLDTHLAAGSF